MGGLFAKDKAAGGGAIAKAGPGKAAATLSVKDRAVLDLKVARDRLDKARRKQETEAAGLVIKAREQLRAGKKDNAKLALRLKKMREVQLEKVNDQLFNLEKLVNDVEWAGHQKEIVDGMKAGNAALKALSLDVDEVQAVMDESAEAVARQREIDAIISGALDAEDEAAALEELGQIEQEEAAHLEVDLPSAPKGKVDVDGVQVDVGKKPAAASEERQAVLA
jgi:charged multivesicular body protein 6